MLAGVNGAGKSSVGGSGLREAGLDWYNPDTVTREARAAGLGLEEANEYAWKQGVARLKEAMAKLTNFAFETTLGGRTIVELLIAATKTHDVKMWYCGLASVDQHIARVAQRVAAKGHAIPEARIRERWTTSRVHLVRLMPHLALLQVYDNSVDAALGDDIPEPRLVLEMSNGTVVAPDRRDPQALLAVPSWAKSLVEAAFRTTGKSPPGGAVPAVPRQGKVRPK